MRFAHLADIHLGFQKYEALQKIEQEVFERALDDCVTKKVDFILIPGDLFHVNIPEMRVQKFAFRKFKEIHDLGIPVYVVYGSHDFSPVSNSVIDLLVETGYLTKVTKVIGVDQKIHLDFIVDKKTGALIAGLSGLKAGKDSMWYEKLDRESLESVPGFKIFLFHGGLDEMKTEETAEGDFMPLSLLPRNFDYYAGGHLHTFSHQKYSDYPNVVYPGTVFAGYHSDLEENAKGRKRGYVLVDFDDKVNNVEFVEIPNVKYEYVEIDAKNKASKSVNSELAGKVLEIDASGKVIVIRVEGELAQGKTSDVDFFLAKRVLKEKGALEIKINQNKLSSREYKITEAAGRNKEEIESNVFKENIGQLRINQKELLSDSGVDVAKKLLAALSMPILENEKKQDYAKRVEQTALDILGLSK
jgi:DNA repair exonuclease SbcCD nuclease subunit